MKTEVAASIEELKRQFSTSSFTIHEDGQGGAYVLIEPITLGPKFNPAETWVGFQIPAQYPYSDIYPVFIGQDVVLTNGAPFSAPITPGHNFQERPAYQISRRNSAAQGGMQRAVTKVLKILDYLENLS